MGKHKSKVKADAEALAAEARQQVAPEAGHEAAMVAGKDNVNQSSPEGEGKSKRQRRREAQLRKLQEQARADAEKAVADASAIAPAARVGTRTQATATKLAMDERTAQPGKQANEKGKQPYKASEAGGDADNLEGDAQMADGGSDVEESNGPQLSKESLDSKLNIMRGDAVDHHDQVMGRMARFREEYRKDTAAHLQQNADILAALHENTKASKRTNQLLELMVEAQGLAPKDPAKILLERIEAVTAEAMVNCEA